MEEIFKQLEKPLNKKSVVHLALQFVEKGITIREIIDLTFLPNKEQGFRAAWILEQIAFNNQELFLPDFSYFCSRFPEVENESCKRHFAKIMEQYSHYLRNSSAVNKNLMDSICSINYEPVIETLFDWLINPKTKTAVIAFSMTALCNFHSLYPWIREELFQQIHFLMKNGSPGIQSRGKYLLKKIA
ncbi:hypothetical protein [Solitalea lacus]|uniref:hypothetical protein n=1 Tax=Solitalea lacus TaxID=2911172 RepID=UPI001EDA2176|nr:hypothetical protein [Solitalea lacus]UKJ09053.1 hypothetical protein L2B55_07770 [Solitalea lacus]